MFRRLREPQTNVTVHVDGEAVAAAPGDSVAAVLLGRADAPRYRASAVSGAARAPYCLIGNCFECLVEIDGVPNRQGCMVTVRDGMRVRRQTDAPGMGMEPKEVGP